MPARFIACICAVLWIYGGVAAILFEYLSLVGPCAAGFVVSLFCAQLLQPGVPFDGENVDGFEHDHESLFFGPDGITK